jgi:hypothetical protein
MKQGLMKDMEGTMTDRGSARRRSSVAVRRGTIAGSTDQLAVARRTSNVVC